MSTTVQTDDGSFLFVGGYNGTHANDAILRYDPPINDTDIGGWTLLQSKLSEVKGRVSATMIDSSQFPECYSG